MPFAENTYRDLNNSAVILDRLLNLYDADRLPNSLLFIAEDVQVTSKVAHALANKILNCTDCTQHMDFFQISSDIVGSAQITADAVRDLIAKIQVSPKISRFKVAYIEHAERMNKYAANSFLKTLEEPPADTVIVLSSPSPYAMLPTIVSRCVIFRFSDHQKIVSPVLDHIINSYESWLELLFNRSKKNLAVIEMYKLLSYIDQHLGELLDEEDADKMDSELILLKALEISTEKTFRAHSEEVLNLHKIISFFEDLHYFLAINCNLISCLERCFLLIIQWFSRD